VSVRSLLGASYGQQWRQIRDEENSVEQLPWVVVASCIKCRAGRTRVRRCRGCQSRHANAGFVNTHITSLMNLTPHQFLT
jgi:hypothetical protein